jgi:ppGpp synthetase/RelA/SpoT-type nucleotidyltranferase
MSLVKKYESIDQSKLKPAVRDILKKMKDKSENFTKAEVNKKVEPALDKLLVRLEKELPEAIKKPTKKVSKPKKEVKAKATKKTVTKKTTKKATKKATQTKTTKPKKEGAKEHISTRASKLAKKEGITFKEARARLSKEAKEKEKKETKTALDELQKLISSTEFQKDLTKFPKKNKGGERKLDSDLERDAKRPALPRGKRTSKSGKTYYEYRDNRSDVRQSGYPYLADGGAIDSLKKDMNSKLDIHSEYYAKGGSIDGFTLNTVKGVVNKPTEMLVEDVTIDYEDGGEIETKREFVEVVNQVKDENEAFPNDFVNVMDSINAILQDRGYEEDDEYTYDVRQEILDRYEKKVLEKQGLRFAKGGRTISIVNDGVKYDKSKYKAVYGDFDNDGTVNIDDANPLDSSKKGRVEQIELRNTFDKLLNVKAELDTIMYDAVDTLDEKAPKDADIYARTKTPYSIIKKLVEKRMLDPKKGLTDMIGTTIAVKNQKELEQVRDDIDGGLLGKVLDRDDFYKTPNAGYRAYHYIVEYKGVPVEVQLKTKNMKKLHEVSHEAYKNGNLDAKSLDSVSKTFMEADKGDAKAKAEISKLLKDKKLLASKVSKGSMAKGGEVDFSKRTSDDFKLGELVYDTKNKRYGTIIGIYNKYNSDVFEVRLDSDGMQYTSGLRKLGEKGDNGTKKQLFEAVSSYERLRKDYPKNKYPKMINNPFYAKGGKIGFDGLAKKVAKSYEGKPVEKQFQDEYGKKYNKKEAMEVGKKVAGKVYRQQQAMAKGGEVLEYSKIYEILKDKIDDSVVDIESTYEQAVNTKGEEVEYKSRDGFIPFTNGGYSSRWFEYSNMLEGSGMNLPTASLDEKIEEFRERNREYGFERFEEEYPEIVEELGGIENVNYSELEDAGYSNEADDLDMFMQDDEDSIMMEVEAFYYNPNNDRGEDGKHTIQLSGVVNLEAPYHRSGNLEDYIEERFTFDSYKELEDKLDKALMKVVSWFEGDMYDKTSRELKIRRMEAGGTLPTPFGQAGLVGETGAMNEMDMFAMGGGLPQGVHQYYANTYNPAYPTPHGYAKGGELQSVVNTAKMSAKLKKGKIKGTAEYHKIRNEMYDNAVEKGFFDDTDDNFELFDKTLGNELDVEYYAKGGKTKRSKHSLMQDRRRVSSEPWEVAYQKRKKNRMEAGGTLPTAFGQAGLVGETGTLNEMELFAMGGGLPQGVHQYYANTYNPAYPTPHGYAKGGKTQGYNDKLDESLGNTKGKRSTKEQNYKDRRNESEAMEKKGGKRKYARVKTMDKGNRSKRKTPMTLAKEIRKEGEKWQDAVKRASAMLKKK